jgi:hypothetical protein
MFSFLPFFDSMLPCSTFCHILCFMKYSIREFTSSFIITIIFVLPAANAQFFSTFDLNTLNGQNGFVAKGITSEDESGFVVSSAGDINGDGIDDVIVGAHLVDHENNMFNIGHSYVIFGSVNGPLHPFELSDLDGQNGFTIVGAAAHDQAGYSVSNAGDINGDNIDDLLIGARLADWGNRFDTGISYVIFGSQNGFTHPFDLSSINGVNGFSIIGEYTGDESASAVSAAGDVNGDGIDDLIIGARRADLGGGRTSAGRSYVIFGSNSGLAHPFDLFTLDGNNGFTIYGIERNDESGYSVSTAGDINNDGVDDVIIGAIGADPNDISNAGISYVVYGSNKSLSHPLNLNNLNGQNGFAIHGVSSDDFSGRSVSAAGDINNDGVDDLIIGASGADPNGNNAAGSSYIVFGSEGGLPHPFELSTLNGQNGFMVEGESTNDLSGGSVSNVGDVNHDGIDDLVIGARWSGLGSFNAGSSYVVFGSEQNFNSPMNVANLNGQNGFAITGEDDNDISGSSVSHAGDVNGDGIDDLIIGAYRADPNGIYNAGKSYVVYGKEKPIFKDGFDLMLNN